MEIQTENRDYADKIGTAIKYALTEMIREEAKRIIEDAKREIENQMARIVSEVAINTFGNVSFHDYGQDLRIHVKMDRGK